MISTDNY